MGLIVAPWKFDVLKTSIFALKASLLGQIFVLRTSNVTAVGQLSADSSSTETLYCLISMKWCHFFILPKVRRKLLMNMDN